MKIYYETHKDLFEAVQKWEENWKLFLELEVLSGQEHAGSWVSVHLCSRGQSALGRSREALGSHGGPVQGWGAVFRVVGCLCRAGSSGAFTT